MTARGRDFFLMYLAHALGMTRRQLLNSIDTQELLMWEAYFREMNRPPENKPPGAKQTREQIEGELKNFFAVKMKGKKKRGK